MGQDTESDQTPLRRIEDLSDELVAHYLDGEDAELRVAAKLLLVALDLFRRHGGLEWRQIVAEYIQLAAEDPVRFQQILSVNRGKKD